MIASIQLAFGKPVLLSSLALLTAYLDKADGREQLRFVIQSKGGEQEGKGALRDHIAVAGWSLRPTAIQRNDAGRALNVRVEVSR